MGNVIYGKFDQLVVEHTGIDRVRHGRRVSLPVDRIEEVVAEPTSGADHVAGTHRRPAVVIRLHGGERYVVECRDAVEVAADLTRRGVGARRQRS
jgi:hypothetical protein